HRPNSIRNEIFARSEFGRAFSINNLARHANIWKLLPIRCATQHQSATAHVAATDEISRESQLLPKTRQQNIDIFSCGNAAWKDDLASGWQLSCQTSRVPLKRCSITRIVLMNVDRGEFTQVIEINSCCCIDKSARRPNDKHTWGSPRRARKCSCVSNFTAKVKAAQKSEHLGDRRALFVAQFSREFEFRPIAQNHPCSFTTRVSRREKKNCDPILHFITISRFTSWGDLNVLLVHQVH